jgi:hypothetical protein
MEPNHYQIRGKHYIKLKYQPWDFIVDTQMPYLLGCVIEYVSRWRDKNGLEDLRKSLHYIHKATDCNVYMPPLVSGTFIKRKDKRCFVNRFCKQLPSTEGEIINSICKNEFEEATKLINDLIVKTAW